MQREIRNTYEQLNEAQLLDPTGLTTAMLLRSMVEWWTKEVTYSANDLLNNTSQVQTEIAKMREVITILEQPEVKEPTDEFLANLEAATKHYELGTLLQDPFEIAYLRRDALKAIQKLQAHQFLRGKASEQPLEYSKNIYQFWNINSLIHEVARSTSAVILTLIRDANAYHSYFVFTIKNGENLSVLTDKPDWAHPQQKNMVRRPDRRFEKRAFNYHFPYALMDFDMDEDGIHIPEQEGLVRYNTEAIILGNISQVPPNSAIWLTMMLALINDRYWKQNYPAKQLSYTAEMAACPKQITNVTATTQLIVQKKLNLPQITAKDVQTDALIKQWEREPTRENEWMIQRYTVPNQVLNIIGKPKDIKIAAKKDLSVQLLGLDPTEFGTRSKLLGDAKWVARYNQAVVLSNLAKEEYDKTHQQVFEWFEKHVIANKESLVQAIAKGDFTTIAQVKKSNFDYTKEVEKNVLKLWYSPNKQISTYGRRAVWLGARDDRWYRYCCVTNLKASIFGRIIPNVPQALAKLANCAVADLPFGLQKYFVRTPYGGNPILDRLDPVDWVPDNPWAKLRLVVIVCLSKRAFNKTRETLGLKKFKKEDWDRITDTSEYL